MMKKLLDDHLVALRALLVMVQIYEATPSAYARERMFAAAKTAKAADDALLAALARQIEQALAEARRADFVVGLLKRLGVDLGGTR